MSLAEEPGGAQSAPPPDRSITSLLADLAASMTALVSKEVELAKAELAERVNAAGRGIGQMLIGGAILFCGLLLLLASATLGLSQVMAPWMAALVIGVVVGLIGLALLLAGKAKLRPVMDPPRRTMANLRADVREVADTLSSR